MEIIAYHTEKSCNSVFPNPLRCLIIGSSGSGKTNLLLNFIYNKDGLRFKNLYVFSRSIEQPAYRQLRKRYNQVENEIKKTISHFVSNSEELIPLDECEPNSLVVFDDCLLGEQTKIKDYFIRGRHKQISCIYLSQSYGRVDMQVIRNNINLLCAFNQNKYYMKRIFDDFVGSDMNFNQFEKMCTRCWENPYGFISIHMTRQLRNCKYTSMLNKSLEIN